VLAGGVAMSTANINVRTDAILKAQAQQIFDSVGLDLSTAVNLFLKQTVKANNLPFTVGVSCPVEKTAAKRASRYGVWKGKYTLPENFDAPPDDFEEYM
jgi:DNA-damage-inducible protein J